MRLLVISAYFHPHQGGSERYVEELYAHLLQNDPTVQADVVCYNTEHASDNEQYRGMTIYRIPCFEMLHHQFVLPNYFLLIALLRRLFRKNTYDAIHSNTRFFEHSWWTPFAAKRIGAVSILSDHCSYHPIHSSKVISWFSTYMDTLLIPLFIRHYTCVTVSNKNTQTFLERYGVKKIRLIYAGAGEPAFHLNRTANSFIIPNTSVSVPPGRMIITYIGRFIQSKYPELFVRSIHDILKKNPNVICVMAGDGPLYDRIKKQAPGALVFTGRLSTLQCAQLLSRTDIFVHLSIHRDGLPSVILDAGAHGCAVVTTGAPEIIKHKQNGIVIVPRIKNIQNAIEYLLDNAKLRNGIRKKLTSEISMQFTWQKSTRALRDVLSAYIQRHE